MSLEISFATVSQFIGSYFWPFARIAGFFMTVPIIGARIIAVRVRLVLALTVTIMVVPQLNLLQNPLPFSALSVSGIILLLNQVLIGVMMGFIVQIFFQSFVLGGQFIAMQNGLGFATLVDPVNGVNVASIGQFYLILSNLLFLSMNSHLVLIDILIGSFTSMPLTDLASTLGLAAGLVANSGSMFKVAVLMALPAVTALLLVNLSFGLMARMSPQLNIFTVGFPFNMVFGFVVIWVSLLGFLPLFESASSDMLFLLRRLLSLG